jgi:hypothetical protein
MRAGYSPHIPRRGAPQAPQGPDSVAAVERDAPTTANTESSFSTRALPHCLQVAVASAELTSFSNLAPHLRH